MSPTSRSECAQQPSLAEVSGLRLTSCSGPLVAKADKAPPSPSGSWAEEAGAFRARPPAICWADLSEEEDAFNNDLAALEKANKKAARTPLSGKAKPFVLGVAAAGAAAAAGAGEGEDDGGTPIKPSSKSGGQDAAAGAAWAAPPALASKPPHTSLILRNVPYAWTRDKLVGLLNSSGFSEAYDFVYVPVDFQSMNSLGYAFVNLTDACHTESFMKTFQNFDDWKCDVCKAKCRVSFSRTQTLGKYVRRFQDSAIMHASVPDECKPAIFLKGVRVPFPEPTKTLRELNSVCQPHFGQRRKKKAWVNQ